MRLQIDFPNIEPHKIDARIDALKRLIDQRLRQTLDELNRTKATISQTNSWYSEYTSRLVHAVAVNSDLPNQAEITANIKVTETDADQKLEKKFIERVNTAMEARPTALQTLGAWFVGAAKSNKLDFLNSLKETGEQILIDAQLALTKAQQELKLAQSDNWSRLQQAQAYYSELAQAISADDPKALLAALKSENSQATPAKIKHELFMLPSAHHASTFLAITQMKFENPIQEAEVIGEALNHFGNDFTALQALQKTIPQITDADTRKKYQSFATAFAGIFIPVTREIMNVNHIGEGYYEHEQGRLRLQDPRGNGRMFTMSQQEARVVLDALAARPNFIAVAGEAMNVNHIGEGYYEHEQGRLRLQDPRGNGRMYTMSQQEARVVLDALAARPNFIAVAGEAMNVNHIGEGYYEQEQGRLRLQDPRGNGRMFTMSQQEARVVLDALAARPNFIAVAGEAMNVNHIGEGYYEQEQGRLRLQDPRGNGRMFTMSQQEARVVLDALAARPNFIAVAGEVMNVNHIGEGYYEQEQGRLRLQDPRGNGRMFTMSQQEARVVLDALAARPNFIAVAGEVMNVNHIGKGYYNQQDGYLRLHDSRGNGREFKLSHQESRVILDALAARPNFIAVAGEVMNVNHICKGHYNEQDGYLRLHDSNGNGREFKLSQHEAYATLQSIRKTGQNLGIIQNNSDHRDELMFGIEVARAWERQSTSRSSDDETSYLPLIIVAGMMFYSENSGATPISIEDIGFQSGGGGDFGGAGAGGEWESLTHNFGDASQGSLDLSALDSIQATLDSMTTDLGAVETSNLDTTPTSSTFDSGIGSSGSDMGYSP